MENCRALWTRCGDTDYSTVEEFVADVSESHMTSAYLKCLKIQLNDDESPRPFETKKIRCVAPCRPPATPHDVWGCLRHTSDGS